MKAILFTKDRPMQFRGLLESFLYNVSDTPLDIYTIVKYRKEYNDIMYEFSGINYIIEQEFETFGDALLEAVIPCRKDLVLLGVDDQIITGPVDLEIAKESLNDEEILCYSYRNGINIKGYSPIIYTMVNDHSIKYLWQGQYNNWGYPFSLDFHVYRGSDLLETMGSYRVPADWEAAVHRDISSFTMGKRLYMSCPHKESVAYCQDLNKVQTEHGAPCYGDPRIHSPEHLIEEYKTGKILDWKLGQGYVGDNAFCKDTIWGIRDKNK